VDRPEDSVKDHLDCFLTYEQLNWLLRTKSNLAIENKRCASKSSISLIQRSQSKILIMIAWYVSNATLHADLGIS
jgi:hypothetical protein